MKKSFSGVECVMAFPALSVIAFALGGVLTALALTLVLVALAFYLERRRFARRRTGTKMVQRRAQMNWAKYSVSLLLLLAIVLIMGCSERTCPTYAGAINKKVSHY